MDARIDAGRGYDHGTFVPMMLIRPDADVPVLQMSLVAGLDPATHIAIGRALAPLLAHGVSVIGSGLSFHNLRALLRGEPMPGTADADFDGWLNDTVLDPDMDDDARAARLTDWRSAPGAAFCHPREEHLLPLHVCFGAAAVAVWGAHTISRYDLMGFATSGFGWSAA
ncbi:MAG: class III extradiol ring-cleavage dioxygenase [Rhodospirillaceae bacterium]